MSRFNESLKATRCSKQQWKQGQSWNRDVLNFDRGILDELHDYIEIDNADDDDDDHYNKMNNVTIYD